MIVDSATPEDLILSKLRDFKAGGSQEHLMDIEGILRVSGAILDRDYIEGWIGKLGLEAE
jgi:hypothetical protein